MKNIIYSKYSNERADEFKIRTDIVEDLLEKRRFVHKKALTQEAHNHIDNIYRNYELLSEMYKGSKIRINKCCKIDSGLEFEYITGPTLKEELDELLFKNEFVLLVEKIREYVSIIESGIGENQFEISHNFIKVFGEVDFHSDLRAGEVNNIDLIFNNIIIGGNWNIIDYEWTFDFLVPFNYIVYRAINYYIFSSAKRDELINLELYTLLGITDDELVQYDIMERNFQAYVLGDLVPLNDLYGTTTEMNVSIHQVIESEKRARLKKRVQIFYDYGQGFREEQSYQINPSLDAQGKINLQIPVANNVIRVRVDPTNYRSVISIESIKGYATEDYCANYTTNGIRLNNSTNLFATNDPQIVITDIKPKTVGITLKFEIYVISKEMTMQLCEVIQNSTKKVIRLTNQVSDLKDEANDLKDEASDLKNEASDLKNEVSDLKNETRNFKSGINDLKNEVSDLTDRLFQIETKYNVITNSKSWKVTKPLRVAMDLLKKGKSKIFG